MNIVSRGLAPQSYQSASDPLLDNAAIVFTALSNAVRLGVLLRLIEREWSVGELAADLKMGQSAVSQHLGKLREAGVVCSRKDKQTVFYHCSDDTVIRLLAEIGLNR